MIKAVLSKSDGKKVLILGLSRRNTELLLADKPIGFQLDELCAPADLAKIDYVAIVGGETESAIWEQLKAHGFAVTDETRIIGDRSIVKGPE